MSKATPTPLYAHPMPNSQGLLDSSKTITKENLPPLPEPHCKHGGGIGYFDSYSKEQMIEFAKSAIDRHKAMLAAAPRYTGESKMTQRYKFTTQLAPTLDGDYDVVTIAVPDDQGDYVRHDAVSHLIEEKTIEQHRSEFEQWAAKEGLRITKRGNSDYVAPFTLIAWRAWQAAKGENNDI